METDELMIVESSSSLHLTESDEEATPGLSKLSSSCSSSSLASSDEDESPVNPEAPKTKQAQSDKETSASCSISDNNSPSGKTGPIVSQEAAAKEGDSRQIHPAGTAQDSSSATVTVEAEVSDKTEEPQLEILNSEQQVDGSLHIEVKDDGCGDPEESSAAKIQRLARKAGIIVGGGTMTAVGTVMLFLPCPTPSIYLMIGGMAIMSKEIPAAQRQLDDTRTSLQGWVERAEKEIAESVKKITVIVDSGSPTKKEKRDDDEEEEEEVEGAEERKEKTNHTPTPIASAEVVHHPHNPVKRHFVKSCRNVILPLLNKVCTPQELLQKVTSPMNKAASPQAATEPNPDLPRTPSNADAVVEENNSPIVSPFARWTRYRETKREDLVKAEEQREREAMLARINEANLKKLQEEASDDVVQENQEEEEEDDEEDETPKLSESLQRLLFPSESAVIRV